MRDTQAQRGIGWLLVVTLLVTLVVWACYSWPLPRYLTRGIPSAADRHDSKPVRYMIHGDHLQLLYHFWLVEDMIFGETPWFHNLYEFNTGNDAERFNPHHYFVPFSVIYALVAQWGSRALGWNATGFCSLWFAYFFSWLLVRRYTRDDLSAGICSLIALLLPFQWIKLLGGSPTGFGMLWIPAYLLGIDLAIGDRKLRGGFLTGAAIFFAKCVDSHLFYFAALITPFWVVIALLNGGRFAWKERRTYLEFLRALWPIAVFLLAAAVLMYFTQQRIEVSTMSGGRGIHEVALYSPRWPGFFAWAGTSGISYQIYVGFTALGLVAVGILLYVTGLLSRQLPRFRTPWIFVLFLAALLGVALLALGPYSPYHGKLFQWARRFLPHYDKMRQPAKVYCLMPALLSVSTGLSLAALFRLIGARRKLRIACAILVIALLTGEYRTRIAPLICLLDREQGAYAAVAKHAREQGNEPRVIVVPFWPGDTAWSSLYEYYVSLYHIRMLNGYSPVVPRTYMEDIFLPLFSVNKGLLTDEQIEHLRSRGIEYLLLHEDAFPEKVNTFPSIHTLNGFLTHPRLKLLTQDEAVWAFQIVDEDSSLEPLTTCDTYCPSRRFEAETFSRDRAEVGFDKTAGGYAYVTLDKPGVAVRSQTTSVGSAPNLHWLVRARGNGALQTQVLKRSGITETGVLQVASLEWNWYTVPFDIPFHDRIEVRFEAMTNAAVDLDLVILCAGDWTPPGKGETFEIDALCLFHSGYTDRERGEVVFRASREQEFIIFYGPKLPFDAGTYRIEIDYESGAPAGTVLGRFNMRADEKDDTGWVEIRAGEPAETIYCHGVNLPLLFAFYFSREADMTIQRVRFTRVD